MSLNPWIAKGNEGYNPYIGVYAPLSFESKTNPEIRQPYVNGHYCYAAKAVIVINGLGVVGHISMFNQRFCQMHPEAIAKQTDDPDTDKEIGGSVALRHVLSDFFTALEEYHFFDLYCRFCLRFLRQIFYAQKRVWLFQSCYSHKCKEFQIFKRPLRCRITPICPLTIEKIQIHLRLLTTGSIASFLCKPISSFRASLNSLVSF